MEWLGKAMRAERPDFANIYVNGASKLLTRHHETLDTLLKRVYSALIETYGRLGENERTSEYERKVSEM